MNRRAFLTGLLSSTAVVAVPASGMVIQSWDTALLASGPVAYVYAYDRAYWFSIGGDGVLRWSEPWVKIDGWR